MPIRGLSPLPDSGTVPTAHFTKAYSRPLTESGLIARSDPEHPNSLLQKYILAEEGRDRIRRVAPL